MFNQCLPYEILKGLKVNIQTTLKVDTVCGADMLADSMTDSYVYLFL